MGISDYDRKKGRRMPGVCSFNEDEVLVFHDARVKARLKHVVHFTSFECKAKYKRHAPSHEGTKTSKSKTCPNENKPSWITYMQSSEVIFSWGWRNRTRSITEDNVELKAVYHDFKSIGGKTKTHAPGNTHAYIQTQLDRYHISEMVAEKALDAWEKSLPPPKPTRRCPRPDQVSDEHGLVTIAPFNGVEYGQEYLSFAAGEAIMAVEHPESGSGWSFGVLLTSQQTGWHPTEFVQRCQSNWSVHTA